MTQTACGFDAFLFDRPEVSADSGPIADNGAPTRPKVHDLASLRLARRSDVGATLAKMWSPRT